MNDNQLQSVNISWSPLRGYYVYTLTVISSGIGPQSFLLDTPYFTFTAPESASPCEVYNFSVTATYDYSLELKSGEITLKLLVAVR